MEAVQQFNYGEIVPTQPQNQTSWYIPTAYSARERGSPAHKWDYYGHLY